MTKLDIITLILYLTTVLYLGLRFRSKNKTHAEFFLAGRNMGFIPIGLSVMVTSFSAINYLAFPNEVFGFGLYVIFAIPVFFIIAWPISKIWMPFFHSMQLTSAYQYLELRFNWQVRSLASALFILWRLIWMATALYAAGNLLAAFTSYKPSTVIIIAGIVATAYTFIGGMRAVMWTDVLQFCVLFGSIALGLLYASKDSSFAEIFTIAAQHGRLKPFTPFDPSYFSLDPRIRMTFFSCIIGVSVAFLSRYGSDQVIMQRYFTAKNLRAAQKGIWLNALASAFAISLLALFGLAIFAHAVKSGALTDINNAAIPKLAKPQFLAMIKSFPSGLTGLFASGLLAASMSSIDSGINACSAAYITDLHPKIFKNQTGTAILDKILTLSLGILSTTLALTLIPLIGKTNTLFMIVNKVINGLGSPLLALFLLGMFSKRVNAPGIFIGTITGLAASMYITFAVKPLALHYYAAVNLLATIIPCYLFSIIASWSGYTPATNKITQTCLFWRKNSKM
ncbi:MAG: sodium/solute symporter [Phycisphaerae bacterium]|nr:sodium/solute symporter [Phycisphaerae bacterium]